MLLRFCFRFCFYFFSDTRRYDEDARGDRDGLLCLFLFFFLLVCKEALASDGLILLYFVVTGKAWSDTINQIKILHGL